MASGLALEETELRLGLPGGGGGGGGGGGDGSEALKSSGKRGFAETIDLKLQLQTPVDAAEEEAAEKGRAASLKHKCDGGSGSDDPEKPPAPKAQVVGWPPVRSFRKNILSSVHRTEKGSSSKEEGGGGDKSGSPGAAALVKVSMDGAPYLRKVDLKTYRSYQELSMALQKMFGSFTSADDDDRACEGQQRLSPRITWDEERTGGNYNYGTQQGGLLSRRDLAKEEISKVMDALNGSEYVPTYEDKDGDWMLVGDVPWEMFVDCCKRLRIMKGSEAIGLAPRAMEKCKNRS